MFATKPEIALAQMRQAVAAGVPMGVVLADAGYGDETAFRDCITALRLTLRGWHSPSHHGMGSWH